MDSALAQVTASVGYRPAPPFFPRCIMELLLIGAVAGAVVTAAVMVTHFVVTKKEEWEEIMLMKTALRNRVHTLTAENAKLRVALSVGEMTEDGKKVAAMTMAALGVVIS